MNQRSSAAFAPASLAGHPIRRQIATGRRARRAMIDGGSLFSRAAAPPRGEDELKLFALSFTAFFVCIYTMIF